VVNAAVAAADAAAVGSVDFVVVFRRSSFLLLQLFYILLECS
jgi:hypothetical protein